jgi:hypothetical protein
MRRTCPSRPGSRNTDTRARGPLRLRYRVKGLAPSAQSLWRSRRLEAHGSLGERQSRTPREVVRFCRMLTMALARAGHAPAATGAEMDVRAGSPGTSGRQDAHLRHASPIGPLRGRENATASRQGERPGRPGDGPAVASDGSGAGDPRTTSPRTKGAMSTKREVTPEPVSAQRSPLASGSVREQLFRGAVGLAAAMLAIVLVAVVGPISLVLLLLTAVAWRGCPTCWTVGLLGTLADARARRGCSRC